MTEDKILWTARYAEGDLSEDERQEYENLLKHDKELNEHLLDYHDAHGSLRMFMAYDDKRNALLAGIQEFNQSYFKDDKHVAPATTDKPLKIVKPSVYLRWISGAAAILILAMFIWWPRNGDLYQQYYQTPSMSVTERGAAQTDLDKAATLFNAQQYKEAKPLLAKLNADDPNNAAVAYYFAITLLQTNEIARGRLLLEDLFKGHSVYKYDAAYAMAMSYLKEDKKADAKFWLQKVSDAAVQYQRAEELLKKL